MLSKRGKEKKDKKGYYWLTRAGNVGIFLFCSINAIDIDPSMVTEIGLFLHNFIRKVNEMHDKYLAQPTICIRVCRLPRIDRVILR